MEKLYKFNRLFDIAVPKLGKIMFDDPVAKFVLATEYGFPADW